MDNKKEVTIITGASKGIGKAIALKLAANKHDVAIFGRDSDKLVELEKTMWELGSDVLHFTGDVADEDFVVSSIGQILAKYGRIDHLINNAGVAIFTKFVDSSLYEFKRQIDTNVFGIYNFSRAVISHMIDRKSGSIINISSLAGKTGFVGGTMYSSTKHAVMGFTKSLMLEVREHNIRVAAVCPGSVSTDMILNTPLEPKDISKALEPEDVADVVTAILKLPARALVSEIEVRPTNVK
ncbi:MAG: SDR family NAD(P)-dependent oxidoreductase [Ignavibacteriae bacterium]|jgi:3-oxoacyl-[acyl-carrier protein] reductase|nr:SDR family NAD(P)-dependent oxidoreductase [Ignavibacteriota bacterium]NOG97663.1 SDR family NAD(P)-dependent oxidoreductase [Ignavibacteriota bacterium]